MSDALPLPPDPNLAQYERFAKDLQKASESGEPKAIHDCVARGHGFANWPAFAEHVEALGRADSPVSQFEAAVEAIIRGDSATLKRLLGENPELARARSTRAHRSTLLHYVSANGVEDYRQKTPANIVEIARLLLDSGAEVNAESDAYGGHSTTLELTATSCHPENAGVQIPLMELLLASGAHPDRTDGASAVNSCLANGRGQAAEFLAKRGARLDLEGAAGVGRLDLVTEFLHDAAMRNQIAAGFAWACEYGRTSVVELLLRSGIDVNAKREPHGQTGLHWAAYGGHAEIVRLLVERGAAIGARDDDYEGTPLEWALYAWGGAAPPQREPYYGVVAALVRAGGIPDAQWREDIEQKLNHDERMLEALSGRADEGR